MFDLPASLAAYMTDPKIRTAIQLLLAKKRPKPPENLKWSELERYHRAQLSVRQLQYDYATALIRIWGETWGDLSGWVPVDPAKQSSDASVELESIWSNAYFAREFVSGGNTAELGVYADEDVGFQLALGVWRRSKSLLSAKSLPDWELDDEYCWTDEHLVPPDGKVDLTPLRKSALQAKEWLAKIEEERGGLAWKT